MFSFPDVCADNCWQYKFILTFFTVFFLVIDMDFYFWVFYDIDYEYDNHFDILILKTKNSLNINA